MNPEKEKLVAEYLELSKKQPNQLIMGLVLGSLVFLVPMILIIVNGWWMPFENDAEVGMRWFVVAIAAIILAYIAITIDKLTRKF